MAREVFRSENSLVDDAGSSFLVTVTPAPEGGGGGGSVIITPEVIDGGTPASPGEGLVDGGAP